MALLGFVPAKNESRIKAQMLCFPAEAEALYRYYCICETANLFDPRALLRSFQSQTIGAATSFTIGINGGDAYWIDYITWTLQDCVDPSAPPRTGSIETAGGKAWCLSTDSVDGTGLNNQNTYYLLNGPGCKPSQDFLLPSPITPPATTPSCSPELSLTIHCNHPDLINMDTTDKIRVRVWSGDSTRAFADGTDWIDDLCPQAQTLR